MSNALDISRSDTGVFLKLKIVPGSSRTEISDVYEGMLKIKVAAPPEKGKANKMLMNFLAKKMGITKKQITIKSGQTSPIKMIHIEGVIQEDVEKLLENSER